MRNREPQVNFQADCEFIEDLRVIASRRKQTLSEFIRRTLTAEMVQESCRTVVD